MKLTGAMLGSENPKALGEFYTKVFGNPDWQQDDWYGFNANGGFLLIGGHSEVHGTNQNPARIMVTFSSEEVQADFDRIKGVGANVVAEPYNPDPDNKEMWLATLSDPDGNYIQISSPWKE